MKKGSKCPLAPMPMPYFSCLLPGPNFIWPAWSGRMWRCTRAIAVRDEEQA
eukprot:CAMPEP_0185909308 /NCGR_PEP_ID=MMETSP0196C-20130402/12087_1 /TAXON_ID=2932 /ORGANISM="Alexandrium fundyense, Strain CCMP1719" /LENGTH=50 /DNA_ID=CAMNT_0028629763 /DNA_START=46 /DNA_END=194 /DNA_ORIENTATION=+